MTIRSATEALAEQHRARLMAEAQQHRVLRAARHSRSDRTELAKTTHRPWLLRWLGQGLTPAVVTDATVSAEPERHPDPTAPAGAAIRRPRTQRGRPQAVLEGKRQRKASIAWRRARQH